MTDLLLQPGTHPGTQRGAGPAARGAPDRDDGHASVRAVIDQVLADLGQSPRLAHVEHVPARPATTDDLATPLPDALARCLPHTRFWSHQARALDLVRSGRSVAVATGTSSGKSLCYQVPAAEAALTGGTSLFLFPTKALAQDQLLSMSSWEVPGVVAATYDGDCTPEERTWVRGNADVLLTNPEMLHQGILPNHGRWAPFLHRLRIIAVDELHVLRGVFGTHTGQVLRRLLRLARHYGADPTLVFTSATIGDPAGLAGDLCGQAVVAVDVDAAPAGERVVALWNPDAPRLPDDGSDDGCGDGGEAGGEPADERRWSVNAEAAQVAARLVDAGLRTLVFCRSRRGTELVAADLRRLVDPALAGGIRSYRAGYLADERREIEADLFGGRLHAVVATNALELGVDIGGLDAVVMCGYPGTVASFRQQVGRGGRSSRPSLAVLVAGQDQLDQWIMRHPRALFDRPPEPAVVNLDNPFVYVPHLGCAAHELPLRHEDLDHWPDQLDDGVRRLVLDDRAAVRRRSGRRVAVWTGRGLPAPTIGLRSASRGEFRIRDTGDAVIGTVDEARANEVVHPGAVYLHQGRAWRVLDLDRDARTAVVEPHDEDTYTLARTQTSIALLERERTATVGRSSLGLGWVEVTSQVIGYQVRSTTGHEVLDRHDLDLPPSSLYTRAVWYSFDDRLLSDAGVSPAELGGALHAAEHAAIGILPLFTICDRWDVGGVSTPFLPETGGATVVIHDAHPGGAGIAELAFDAADRHLSATLEVLRTCACSDGCPGCVQSPKCGNGNEPLDKHAAERLLHRTLA
jgi:DEAD/DEAH box helicase domain-containing protein